MTLFSSEDLVGMVKRFEVGEYNGNLLPLIYTKVRDWINPANKKPSIAMSVKVEKGGELYDIQDIDLKEVFVVLPNDVLKGDEDDSSTSD